MNPSFWNHLARKYRTTGYRDLSYAAFDQYMRIYTLENIISRYIPSENWRNLTVLDYGCGTGDFLEYFSDHFFHLTGYDLSDQILLHAQNKLKKKTNVSFINDLAHLTGSYDIVICVTVLQHILSDKELQTTLQLIRSHLKPLSYLFCLESVFNASYPLPVPEYIKPRTLDRWIELFSESGYQFADSFAFYNPGIFPTPSYRIYRQKTLFLRSIYRTLNRLHVPTFFLYPFFRSKAIRLLSNPEMRDGLIPEESFSQFMIFQAKPV